MAARKTAAKKPRAKKTAKVAPLKLVPHVHLLPLCRAGKHNVACKVPPFKGRPEASCKPLNITVPGVRGKVILCICTHRLP